MSACFTKSYGRYIKGTGSVLAIKMDTTTGNHSNSVESSYGNSTATIFDSEELCGKRKLECVDSSNNDISNRIAVEEIGLEKFLLTHSLRYFSPSELLKLFGFPHSFTFPANVPRRKQYELIGNSINVTVVAELLKELLVPSG